MKQNVGILKQFKTFEIKVKYCVESATLWA